MSYRRQELRVEMRMAFRDSESFTLSLLMSCSGTLLEVFKYQKEQIKVEEGQLEDQQIITVSLAIHFLSRIEQNRFFFLLQEKTHVYKAIP
jgi:hypothetical protein